MEFFCKDCRFFKKCLGSCKFAGSDYSDSRPCIDFEFKKREFVLIHYYHETEHISIVAFGDSYSDLWPVMFQHPRYGSNRHSFFIFPNPTGVFGSQPCPHPLFEGMIFNDVKDNCLLNVCKNVAQYLSIGEYAMLKKSFFKASAWFEKAKNSAALGADILYNY